MIYLKILAATNTTGPPIAAINNTKNNGVYAGLSLASLFCGTADGVAFDLLDLESDAGLVALAIADSNSFR